MKVRAAVVEGFDTPYAVVDDALDEQGCRWLSNFLADARGNEDIYLDALARAESGTPELYFTNNAVYASMYPDGRVEITPREFLLAESEQDNPPKVVITIAEARKLILDWLAAEKEWYAARDAQRLSTNQPLAAAEVAAHPGTNSESRGG